MGRLELVQTERGSNEHLDSIADSLDRMNHIIEDTLVLAREGQVIEAVEWVRISAVVDAAWEQVETTEATLEIVDAFELRCDEDRIQQLLENLFSNAVNHGGPDVRVRVGMLDGVERFYVEDDGVRIESAERERVFESGHTSTGDGTGLGLSIVGNITDAHGWAVRATESTDSGARVRRRGE